ncbi:hypothetical protein CC86DRAFT_395760 [Ophiobolus disseminans]|uniref:Mid2 domain-containing protein n=1 Tax=Ophiobolus disseminans TaxID=1469910 RepID=A0A6A6ZTA5_9PLEO|nr:hypothetical protein CC86DRAFT_395760 [Ophiobolus disseminans]
MCSQDTLTKKFYCCEPGSTDSVCWKGRETCNGGTDTPSDQQLGCIYRQSSGDVKYCCDKKTEDCTSRDRQFNICWSKGENSLRSLNATRLNQTYVSLLSASPTATSIAINKVQLLAMTGVDPSDRPSSSTSAASSTPASATASATSTSSATPSPADDGGLSGGAIGGIVGGVVGGLALLGAIAFFFWRRRKTTGKIDTNAPPGDPYQGYGYQPGHQPQPQQQYHEAAYSPQPAMAQPYSPPPTDKYAHQAPVHEAPAYNNPVEMDATYYSQQHQQTK